MDAGRRLARAQEVLERRFGYRSFRTGQEQLVHAVLDGRDCLGVMPTGAGKSLCYQVPGVVLGGLTLVISPLISLMQDQVDALKEAGVRGSYMNGMLTPGQQATVMQRALNGAYDLMYVAPERLADQRFLAFAQEAAIPFVAVDEAHCVSQWGQDFRPAYLQVRAFVDELPTRPVLGAYTATATSRVRADICRLLGLENPQCVVTGFDRPNLHYAVEQVGGAAKRRRVLEYVSERPRESGIVYCSTRRDVEGLHRHLCENGVAAGRYHAGLSPLEREDAQRAFVNDDLNVLVATNAFGMGIDKSNVRYVVHHNMPGSIEAYYQEAGRAGRDGEPSDCLLLWSDRDIATCRFFIEQEVENEQLTPDELDAVRAGKRRLLARMVGYCLTTRCLRDYILDYFGEGLSQPCGNCSNCAGGFERQDVTEAALEVLRCVQELRGRFGKGMVVDVLRGSKSERLASFGLMSAKSYGTSTQSAALLKEVIEQLASEELLTITEGKFPLVSLGPRARTAVEPGFKLEIKRAPRVKAQRQAGAAPGKVGRKAGKGAQGLDADDAALFEELRVLRKQLADAAGIAPFIVFSDASLRDMCALRPASDEEFLQVSGVGATKLERYGAPFLEAIRSHEPQAAGEGE